MDVTTIILESTPFVMPKRAAPRDVGGCVVSLVNILTGEPLPLYAAMCQKHMFLIRCSNAELQNIFAIGCNVTTVKEPTGVARMWEENRISFIGVAAFGKWASRAVRSRIFCDK